MSSRMFPRFSTVFLLILPFTAAAADAPDAKPVDRGRYLVAIMDCAGCHTDGALAGQPNPERYLGGSSIGFGSPDGVVYPPNLTPDKETGLGAWSDEQISAAFRSGQRPDGRMLAPIMPWPGYATLNDADARAVIAYLRSVAPVRFKVPQPVPAGMPATAPYLGLVTPQGTADAE